MGREVIVKMCSTHDIVVSTLCTHSEVLIVSLDQYKTPILDFIKSYRNMA